MIFRLITCYFPPVKYKIDVFRKAVDQMIGFRQTRSAFKDKCFVIFAVMEEMIENKTDPKVLLDRFRSDTNLQSSRYK